MKVTSLTTSIATGQASCYFLTPCAPFECHGRVCLGAVKRSQQLPVEQPVKQLFAGLAADREAPRFVCARTQTPLHGLADVDIFLLDSVSHSDALSRLGSVARVGEEKIEHHPA